MLGGVAALALLAAQVGTGAVAHALRAVDAGAVLAALGVGLLTVVLNAWRWCLVARGLGLRLALPVAVADCYRATFLNAVLPAGVLGDVHRAVRHGRQSGDVRRGVRAVAVERSAGLLVLAAVGVVVLVAQPALRGVVSGAGVAVVGALLLAALCVPRVRSAVASLLAGVRGAGRWWAVVLLSTAALAGYLGLFVVAARVAGAHAPLVELLPLLVVALAAMGLPFGVGGFGPREVAAASAFGTVGLDPAQGLAVAVVYGALTLVAVLPGLAMLLVRRSPAT